MIIEVILEDEECAGGNVVNFFAYADRVDYSKPRAIWSWERDTIDFAPCSVINLADRRG